MSKPGETVDTPDGPALVVAAERDGDDKPTGYGQAVLVSDLVGNAPTVRVPLSADAKRRHAPEDDHPDDIPQSSGQGFARPF